MVGGPLFLTYTGTNHTSPGIDKMIIVIFLLYGAAIEPDYNR